MLNWNPGGVTREVAAENLQQVGPRPAYEIRIGRTAAVVVERIQSAAQRIVGEIDKRSQAGQQRVLGALQIDLAVLQVDLRLFDFGPVDNRGLDQVLHRSDLVILRNPDLIQRHDVHLVEGRILYSGPAQRVFQNSLLLRQVGARDQQVLFALRYLRGRASHFQRGQCALLHALLVVVEQPLRDAQRLLFEANVVVESHQVPIQVQHRRDGSDQLQLHREIGGFDVVLRHADLAVVYGAAEALQKALRNSEIHITVDCRIQRGVGAVQKAALAGVRHGHTTTGKKLLRVIEVVLTIRVH